MIYKITSNYLIKKNKKQIDLNYIQLFQWLFKYN